MKLKYLVLVLSFYYAVNGHAQEVPEVQQSLITKITASWCPNCGSWGWTFFENILADNDEKAVLLAAHHSGDLVNGVSGSFQSNFNVISQPKFILGNVEQGVTSSNIAAKRTEVKNLVDANYASSPVANTGMASMLDGNTLTIAAKTRFFQAAEGNYHLGLYVVEDGVINNQAGNGTNVSHHNILRASFTPEHFGIPVLNGSIAAGTDTDLTFSLDLDTSWAASNLEIVAIIWDKVGDVYQFVNVNSTTDLNSGIVGIGEIQVQPAAFALSPTVSAAGPVVTIDLKENAAYSLDVFDQQGRHIHSIFSGQQPKGIYQYEIAEASLASGLYFMRLLVNDEIVTKKFVIE